MIAFLLLLALSLSLFVLAVGFVCSASYPVSLFRSVLFGFVPSCSVLFRPVWSFLFPSVSSRFFRLRLSFFLFDLPGVYVPPYPPFDPRILSSHPTRRKARVCVSCMQAMECEIRHWLDSVGPTLFFMCSPPPPPSSSLFFFSDLIFFRHFVGIISVQFCSVLLSSVLLRLVFVAMAVVPTLCLVPRRCISLLGVSTVYRLVTPGTSIDIVGTQDSVAPTRPCTNGRPQKGWRLG